MSKKSRGVVFYEGVSEIDGSPIVGIATFKSSNEKIGNLVQTWILRSDQHPMDAVNSGNDVSICGSCPLRGRIADASERIHKETKFPGDTVNKGRSCYVSVYQAPANIWKLYKQGGYPKLSAEHSKRMIGKGLRYGSYGDPVAIPLMAWKELEKYCTGRTAPGYTHQWKDIRFKSWQHKVMASTHSEVENSLASGMGWRTFRTVVDISQISDNEIVCPASEEGGFTAQCSSCGACNGRRDEKDNRKSIAIVAHGGMKIGLVQAVISAAS